MFDKTEMRSAVDIQQRCYRLLLWVQEAVRRGFIRFDRAHEYSSDADAAAEWISEHYANLPPDGRPVERAGQTLKAFANFFSSYLVTSFDLLENPGTRLISPCGCYCSICSYLGEAPRLRPKKIRPIDKRRAEQLKNVCLDELARENGRSRGNDALSKILANRALSRDVALCAYGREILRRCKGYQDGPEVLALWRQFAWKSTGSPIPGFELKATEILEAEHRLVVALESVS